MGTRLFPRAMAYRQSYDMNADEVHRLWPVHRADLQHVLFEAAMKAGVILRLGCLVVAVDEDGQELSVVVKGGERISADVIVGADGTSTLQLTLVGPSLYAWKLLRAEIVRRAGGLTIVYQVYTLRSERTSFRTQRAYVIVA